MLLVGPVFLKEEKKKKDKTEVPASVAKNVIFYCQLLYVVKGQREGAPGRTGQLHTVGRSKYLNS